MKRILIISAILFGGIVIAQQKKDALKNWKSRDGEIAQKVFTKYQEKENKKFSNNIKRMNLSIWEKSFLNNLDQRKYKKGRCK